MTEDQLTKARRDWNKTQPLSGTMAETYLRAKDITASLPGSLRFVSDIYHRPSGSWRCALVAKVHATRGVHLIFLTKKGEGPPKCSEANLGPVTGGAVEPSDAGGPMVVCTRLETGLSPLSGLLRGPASVWATPSPSGLEAIELPNPVGRLNTAAGGDAKDAQAAANLTARAKVRGWEASHLPAPTGKNRADVMGAQHARRVAT